MRTRAFLKVLRSEIAAHPALSHPILHWLAEDSRGRDEFLAFGLQHYALVSNFTSYLEELLVAAPDSQSKLWLAKVLVDEYGEGSAGRDHAQVYRDFLAAAGAGEGQELATPLHVEVLAFIEGHRQLCREEPFLVGLGALGPGHEWSIPDMFEPIVLGLRRVGFADGEIEYFLLHQEQDLDHGAWLEEALARCVKDGADRRLIRRGALASLELRCRFWDAVQDKIKLHKRQVLTPQARREAAAPVVGCSLAEMRRERRRIVSCP